MNGPTPGYFCNGDPPCEYLHDWYNGGMSVYGRCEKEIWTEIRSWPPKTGCETPANCPLIQKRKDNQ